MKKRGKEKNRSLKGGALKASLIGAIGAIAILILILCIFSAIGLSFENPHAYISPLSYLAIYGSAFFGGFIATKKNGGRDSLLCGLICGSITTAVLCLLLFIVGLILKTESGAISWVFRALTIVFAALGSIVGMKRKTQAKKRKKRRK